MADSTVQGSAAWWRRWACRWWGHDCQSLAPCNGWRCARCGVRHGASWETECPKREDRQHCDHWYDDLRCCACGDDTKEAESA